MMAHAANNKELAKHSATHASSIKPKGLLALGLLELGYGAALVNGNCF
jgi:hypothetical protein